MANVVTFQIDPNTLKGLIIGVTSTTVFFVIVIRVMWKIFSHRQNYPPQGTYGQNRFWNGGGMMSVFLFIFCASSLFNLQTGGFFFSGAITEKQVVSFETNLTVKYEYFAFEQNVKTGEPPQLLT